GVGRHAVTRTPTAGLPAPQNPLRSARQPLKTRARHEVVPVRLWARPASRTSNRSNPRPIFSWAPAASRTHRDGPGVQIDTAVDTVLLVVEAHHGLRRGGAP